MRYFLFFVLPWLLLILTALAYRYDGKVFPVTEIAKIEQNDIRIHDERTSGWLHLSGSFHKKRNCVYKGIEWFILDPATEVERVPVLARFEDKPEIRDEGYHEFNRLAVNIEDPRLVIEDSKAFVYHDCYGGWLWETRSAFYDSRKN